MDPLASATHGGHPPQCVVGLEAFLGHCLDPEIDRAQPRLSQIRDGGWLQRNENSLFKMLLFYGTSSRCGIDTFLLAATRHMFSDN